MDIRTHPAFQPGLANFSVKPRVGVPAGSTVNTASKADQGNGVVISLSSRLTAQLSERMGASDQARMEGAEGISATPTRQASADIDGRIEQYNARGEALRDRMASLDTMVKEAIAGGNGNTASLGSVISGSQQQIAQNNPVVSQMLSVYA